MTDQPPAAPPPVPGGEPSAAPPPTPAQAEAHQRASLHVTEQTRTYPCLSCGANLEFNIAAQKLKCPSCGNEQDIVEDAGRVTEEQDFRAAVEKLRATASTAMQFTGEKEVVCQSCGGHTTFSGSLTATRCPYCATPIQRDDVHDAPSRLAVDGVVPFGIDPKKAHDLVENWINGRWFAPTEFKKYKQTGSFTSVYASYFTYDSEVDTNYTGERGEHYTVTVGSGQDQRTETRTRWHGVSGQVHNSFDDVTILANDGLDQGKVAALEPWPTQTAKPYSAEYVAGHLCRTYDRDVEQCYPPAEAIMDREIQSTIVRQIGGDEQRVHSKQKYVGSLTFKHLLLPVWLLTVVYAGKPFQVFINGVTGEVQGQRPWSKAKLIALVVAIVVALIVIGTIYSKAKGSG